MGRVIKERQGNGSEKRMRERGDMRGGYRYVGQAQHTQTTPCAHTLAQTHVHTCARAHPPQSPLTWPVAVSSRVGGFLHRPQGVREVAWSAKQSGLGTVE